MLSQCPKCSLSKSTGPMGSVLPQCQCDWKLPTAQPQQETDAWHEIVLNQKQFLDKMELLLAKTTTPPQPEQEPVACAECERLRDALKRANGLAEHFERAWYLRGDEIEQLKAQPEQTNIARHEANVQKFLGAPQPEQEPVAWMHNHIEGNVIAHRPADIDRRPDHWTALYPEPKPCPTCEALARTVMLDQTSHDTPPQRKLLTDEKICLIAHNTDPNDWDDLTFKKCWHEGFKAGFREAEIEHNIKG